MFEKHLYSKHPSVYVPIILLKLNLKKKKNHSQKILFHFLPRVYPPCGTVSVWSSTPESKDPVFESHYRQSLGGPLMEIGIKGYFFMLQNTRLGFDNLI